jgi:hypothetical protein
MRRRKFLAGSGLYLGNALLAAGSKASEASSLNGITNSTGVSPEVSFGATPSAFAWGQVSTPPPLIPLPDELAKLAKDQPAAYLSVDFFNTIVFSRFAEAIKRITAVEFFLGSQHLLATAISKADFSGTAGATADIHADPSDPKHQHIALLLRSALNIEALIYIKGDKSKLISAVSVVISQVAVRGSYKDNQLLFNGVDFKTTVKITPGPDPEQTMRDGGITDVREGTRIEGLVAYGAVPEVITNTLGQSHVVNLAELFPSINLGAEAALYPIQNFKKLAIVPASFEINQAAICSCTPGVPLSVQSTSGTLTAPANPHNGDSLGQIKIGGPIAQNIDPLKDLGNRFKSNRGFVGLYMPQKTYEGLTVQVLPAIEIVAQDNGFIGFDARATVGFSKPAVALDAAGGGITLAFDLDISVQAYCTMDIMCVRVPIGHAIILPAPGSKAHLKMGFYPAIDADGTVKLKAILQECDMGSYIATIVGIGTALEILGVTAFIGFLIDVVLSAIVSAKLPGALKDEISKYLGNNEWTLLHFGDLIKSTWPQYFPNLEVEYAVGQNYIVASVDRKG